MSVTSNFSLVSFQQIVDYMAFTVTGSNVYCPNVVPVEGGGNQFVISSGSLQSIINASINFIVPLISQDTALSGFLSYDANLGSSDVINLAQSFALDYIAFRVSVTLYGGVVTGGWDYRLSELDVRRMGAMVAGVKGLIEGYKSSAMSRLNILQPLSIAMEGVNINDVVSQTAPSYY